ncbi:hypothetical protein AX15_006015 [Amanita polypyramis BW_CC]|nr:hypothetical protein AX15_006015 [Amanita polypyramis BW_CC]
MERSPRTVAKLNFPLPLPRPTYRTPYYSLQGRRKVPRPRKPISHFRLDCIIQKVVPLKAGNRSRRMRIIYGMWRRMTHAQRRPWVLMSDEDLRIINCVYGNNRTVFMSALRHHDNGGESQVFAAWAGQYNNGPYDRSRTSNASNSSPCHENIQFLDRDVQGTPTDDLLAEKTALCVHRGWYSTPGFGFIRYVPYTIRPRPNELGLRIGAEAETVLGNDLPVEFPFLEAHRSQYSTPERATYYEPYTERPRPDEASTVNEERGIGLSTPNFF